MGDGKLTTDFLGRDDTATSIVIQPDGKILLAGRSYNGSNYDFAIVRYNANGSLDTTFNEDGKLTTDFDTSEDISPKILLQPDGRILLVGFADNYLALVRYNANGVLDTTFNDDGMLATYLEKTYDAPSIVLQSDGKILLAGLYDDNLALIRYNVNGSKDETFNDGSKMQGTSNDKLVTSMLLQPDGKILSAGTYGGYLSVDRFKANGSLDNDFGTGIYPLSDSIDTQSIIIQPDGKILFAIWVYNGTNFEFEMFRINADVKLDTNFNYDKKIINDFFQYRDIKSIIIQPDGKILVAGSVYNGSNADFALFRYNANGSLDTTFNDDGKLTTAIGTSHDAAYAIALQPDGKILLAGESDNGRNYDFALARYNVDGTLDTTFANDDTSTYSLGASTDFVNEGSIADFILTTTNVASGAQVDYKLSGVSAADVKGGVLSGTATVDANGRATISVFLLADILTEGQETLTLTAAGKTSSIIVNDTSLTPTVPTYELTASSNSVNEGATATFTMITTNLAPETNIDYKLSGVSAADVKGGVLSGTATVDANGRATISVFLLADKLTEGQETLTLTAAGKTSSIIVNDTSNYTYENWAPSLRSNITRYIREDASTTHPIMRIWAYDSENDPITFTMADELHDEATFSVNSKTGEVFLRKSLSFSTPTDKNLDNKYTCHFIVSDGSSQSYIEANFIVLREREQVVQFPVGIVITEGGQFWIIGSFNPGIMINVVSGNNLIGSFVITDDGFFKINMSDYLLFNDQEKILIRTITDDGTTNEIILDPNNFEQFYYGTDFNDVIFGGVGSVVFGGAGDDRIYGFSPDVVADYSGPSTNYNIEISHDGIIVRDRSGADGIDLLIDVHNVGFSDRIVNFSDHLAILRLDPQTLASLIQLYIACFNRAPDVNGISYWGARIHEGMTLQDIAGYFCKSSEFASLYGVQGPIDDFVSSVYENVLGRPPDLGGRSFWSNAIDSGQLSGGAFLTSFISAALENCDPNDAQFIINRTLAGARFAFSSGISDPIFASNFIIDVDQSAQSLHRAFDLIENMSNNLTADPNQLVVQLVGLV